MAFPAPPPNSIHQFIARWWLPLGFVALLTGLFWVPERSQFSKSFYLLTALPALIVATTRPAIIARMLREPMILAFLALSTWVLLSLLWTTSDDSHGSLAKRPLYVFTLFLSCTVMALQDAALFRKTLRLSAIVASIAALTCLLQFFLYPPAGQRLIGTGGLLNPLLTSHVLGFFCAYWIAAWVTHQEQRHWLPLLALTPLAAATLATGSRTPLMAVAACTLWLFFLSNGRRTAIAVIMLGGAGIALATLFPEAILQRGLSHRPQIWQAALEQVSGFLWLGHGYGSEFQFRIAETRHIWSDPHNVEIAVLLELGIVGLTCWLLMYGLAIARCLDIKEHPGIKVASGLLIYGLAAGMTEGSNFLSRPNENWFLIWIPLAILAALSIQQRSRVST